MGHWYWIGVCAGLGVGIGVFVVGALGATRALLGVALVIAGGLGVLVGLAVTALRRRVTGRRRSPPAPR